MIKKFLFFFALLSGAFYAESCSLLDTDSSSNSNFGGGSSATLVLSFSQADYMLTTKAVTGLVDTCDYILTITNASTGSTIYSGKYGAAGDKIDVSAGSYNLSVRSGSFSKPDFSSPLFGDDQSVVVKAGEKLKVVFYCRQMNSGVKLDISPNFLTAYPQSYFTLKGNGGSLVYNYTEKRYAFFQTGTVSLVLNTSGKEQTLISRKLAAGDMLGITVSCSAPASGSSVEEPSLKVALDTTRNWLTAGVNLGGGGSSDDGSSGGSGGSGSLGSSKNNAFDVSQAKENIGADDVWVYGYIVGGDMTSSNIRFETPFTSATNIAISTRTVAKEKESCFSVQLPSGTIREALNLRDNPGNLHRKVFLKGDIVEAYFGIPGLKNITEYEIK